MWQKRTNYFSMLLSLFFILLLALLLYLMKIDNDIKHYNMYHQELDRIRVLNYELDRYFEKAYRYIEYDEVSRLEEAFESRFAIFRKRDVSKELGMEIDGEIRKLEEAYREKKRCLEDFKSVNARATNSIHFLYDLRKTLSKEMFDDASKKILIDHLFFSLSQILMDLPYDREQVLHDLETLLETGGTNRHIRYFYQHSRQLLVNIEKIKTIQKKAAEIPMPVILEKVLENISKQYRKDRYQQTVIAFVFFLFAFIILTLLIFSFRRIRKNTLELQAFRYAIEKSDNAIVITNTNREIEYVNEAFEARSGYRKEEVFGHNPNILKSGLMSDTFYQKLNETLERGEIWQGELINKRKNGTLLYEKASIIPIYIDGELVRYLAVKLDITEYKEQQQRLNQAATVYEIIGDGVLITDKEKRILSVNPAFVEMFGYSESELVGSEPMVIKTLQEDSFFYEQMWNKLLHEDRWSGKLHNRTKEGKVIPIWLTIAVIRDDQGEVENFIAIYTNLQEIIETQERAEYLAYHDSLTGLPNRAYFDLRIGDMLRLAHSLHQQVAVLFIDLDRFKMINDTLGHMIGDKMLIILSKRIKAALEEGMLFARIGGDEFVIMLMHKSVKPRAREIAEQLLSVIREPVEIYDYYLHTTASIGIALFPDDAQEKESIVKYADSAMYAAKEKGKDNYQFYTRQLSLDVQARLNIEQELLHALERGEFSLHYQPQYDLHTGKVSGAEALLRWENKVLGRVSPDAFISVSEETGTIVKIGYFVLEEACRAYARWRDAGYSVRTVSVNISAVQFREEHFLEHFRTILHQTGVDAHCIEVEITERFIMEYSTTNMTILEDLRGLGCRISIDDFGTGYSSMSYMKQLPLDTIKIDRSFIMELPDNMHDVEVSKAIIALSKSLGYQVIAEGIENEEQEIFLRENHCDIGQGYYFAKPMDEEAFTAFLQRHEGA